MNHKFNREGSGPMFCHALGANLTNSDLRRQIYSHKIMDIVPAKCSLLATLQAYPSLTLLEICHKNGWLQAKLAGNKGSIQPSNQGIILPPTPELTVC